jgi:Tfp pilus assembly protein PilF
MRPGRPALAAMLWLSLLPLAGHAALHLPSDDKQVLERIPEQRGGSNRHLKDMRRRLSADPGNASLAAELAEAYYRVAQREGDPRYIGYAQSVLSPWQGRTDAPDAILVGRALSAQYMHDFAAAKLDLDKVLARNPQNLWARSIRAIMQLVQSDFATALSDCRALAAASASLVAIACEPTVRAVTGEAGSAYDALHAALRRHAAAPVNERLWVLTRLAEIAQRLGKAALAEEHYRTALALGVKDQNLLALYAEFLLDEQRPQEAVALLRDEERNDVLFFRLAFAEKLTGAASADKHARELAARIEAARRRGDRLHLADEALFELHFRNNPTAALRLAMENWQSMQREPTDVRLLMEAALAAGEPAAASPALAWMAETRHEDPALRRLSSRLGGIGR